MTELPPLSPRQFWGTYASSGAVRPGTHRGPSTPHPAPCYYIFGWTPSHIRRWWGERRSEARAVRDVVARGGRVERWGPCGCQAPHLDEALLGIPSRRTKKCQGERGDGVPQTTSAKVALLTLHDILNGAIEDLLEELFVERRLA